MDTYITNKIVNNEARATGGNVGYASTIDLFKLYGETTLKGVAGVCTLSDGSQRTDLSEVECNALVGASFNPNLKELSRALILFDLDLLKSEIENQVDVINDTTLSIKLVLSDVQGTQVAPAAFDLELCPLDVAFEEGLGDNISSFGDSYSANWLSPSAGNTWTNGGADNIGAAIATQTFNTGLEDLEMDITSWVKSYWDEADLTVTENLGWMLKYTSTYEDDSKTYFVKRFSSRHTRNPLLRPKIVVSWENYLIDDHLDFYSSTNNNLTIRNYSQGVATSTLNAPKVTLSRGDWSKEAVGSEITVAGLTQTGHYSATINIDPYGVDSDLATDLVASGSLLLQERWTYEDNADPANTILLHSGSVNMKYPLASASGLPKDYRFSILDLKSTYVTTESPQLRLFIREKNLANEPVRIPIQLPSQIIRKAYFQVKDTNSYKVLIPFSDVLSTPDESTRISADADGMYFSFPVSVLPRGRTYTIDIAYYDRGERRVWQSNMAFKVN